jgi:hypothetical protein
MTGRTQVLVSVILALVLCPAGFAAATAPAAQPAETRPQAAAGPAEVLLTSGRQVFALRMSQDWSAPWPSWTWTASQWDELSPARRAWFMGMDDVKPVLGGGYLLVTSSRGGVALVSRADNVCEFYAESINAHSAELVRDRWIVVCSSIRGDELQVFNRYDENRPATKLAGIPLKAAHGAVYDWRSQSLWALGADELLQTKIVEGAGAEPVRIEVLKRFALPSPDGHDLWPYFHYNQPAGPVPDTAKGLFVAVGDGVYVFDLATEKFEPFAPLRNEGNVKCVGDNLRTGQIVYTKADMDATFTTNVRFLNPSEVKALPGKIGIYKTQVYRARWNQPNPFSYKQDAETSSH